MLDSSFPCLSFFICIVEDGGVLVSCVCKALGKGLDAKDTYCVATEQGMVAHICSYSTHEMDTRMIQAQGQPGLQ